MFLYLLFPDEIIGYQQYAGGTCIQDRIHSRQYRQIGVHLKLA